MQRTVSSQGPHVLPASSTEPAAGQLPGTRQSGCPSLLHHGARRRRALPSGQDPTDQKEKQQSAGAVQSLTKPSGTKRRLWHSAHAPAPVLPAWLWAPWLRKASAAHAPRIAPIPRARGQGWGPFGSRRQPRHPAQAGVREPTPAAGCCLYSSSHQGSLPSSPQYLLLEGCYSSARPPSDHLQTAPILTGCKYGRRKDTQTSTVYWF